MPLQVGIEEGSRLTAVCDGGLQYCQYNKKKISLITLLSDLVDSTASYNLNFSEFLPHKFVYSSDLPVPRHPQLSWGSYFMYNLKMAIIKRRNM